PTQEAFRKMASSKLPPILGVVLYLYLFANIWCGLPESVQLYRSRPPLDLRGAKWIRIDPESGANYRGIAKYLTDESTGFITYPGNHSFHFWTGIEPLTQFNGTGWGLLNFDQQAKIIAALQKTERPRIVVQDFALRIWTQNRPEPIRPLVSYILDDCQPVAQIGPFVIFQPKKPAQPTK
ncbi:MAG TPA: hypothetical protein VK968_10485, partial [Roseimicrobium sp.]|nr:hypothetical protein [Roseimicrobium sp.]